LPVLTTRGSREEDPPLRSRERGVSIRYIPEDSSEPRSQPARAAATKLNSTSKAPAGQGMDEVVRPRAVTYRGTCHE
jgi:hypothetical protein